MAGFGGEQVLAQLRHLLGVAVAEPGTRPHDAVGREHGKGGSAHRQ